MLPLAPLGRLPASARALTATATTRFPISFQRRADSFLTTCILDTLVLQTTRLDLSRELLLGVMSTGLRMVKLGLYDPGFEEEIAFYTFDEIYRQVGAARRLLLGRVSYVRVG